MEDLRRYYAILGLQPGASRAQVEQAYRAAEKDLHAQRLADDPLMRGKAQARLKIINEAYLVIATIADGDHALPEDQGIALGPPQDPAKPLSYGDDATESRDASSPATDSAMGLSGTARKADTESASPFPQGATPTEIQPDPLRLLGKEAFLFLAVLAALLMVLLVIRCRPEQRHPPPAIDQKETPAGYAEPSGRGGQTAPPPGGRLTADVATIRRDAEQGNVKAQTVLGYLCTRGTGVPQNLEEAARWFGSAAAQGDAEAQDWLGYLYETGQGVSQDFGEAARWYRLSAEQGNHDAEKNLGLMYARGSGVAASRQEATRWLKKAAANGNREAQEALQKLQVE